MLKLFPSWEFDPKPLLYCSWLLRSHSFPMTQWLLCGNWDFEDFLLWDFLLGRCCCLSFSFQKNSKGRGKGLYANIFFVSVLCFLGELPRGALLVYCSDAHMHSTETKTSINSQKKVLKLTRPVPNLWVLYSLWSVDDSRESATGLPWPRRRGCNRPFW